MAINQKSHTENKAHDITFGIEIECTIPRDEWNNRPIGRYHRGIEIADAPAFIDENGVAHLWKAEKDSSIHTASPYRLCVEIVSPILKGAAGLQNVLDVIDWLNSLSANVNRSTGLHVTVGFPVYNVKAMKRLITLTARHEDALFASTGTDRRENGRWCQPIKNAYRVLEDGVLRNAYRQSRYYVLNLVHAFRGKNRVEFRCFAGTLNKDKMAGHIMTVLGIVELALTARRVAKWDNEPTEQKMFRYQRTNKGRGHKALFVLMKELRWVLLSTDKAPAGQLVDNAARKRAEAKLFAMADKYDAASDN